MIDIFQIIGLLLFWAGLAFFGQVRLKTLLTYFQQEEYEAGRFLAAWREIRLFDVFASILLVAAFVFTLYGVGGPVLYIVLGFALAAIGRREKAYRMKKPLVMTGRATRIYVLALWIAGILSFAALLLPILELVVVQALPLILILANAVLKPAEDRRNAAYVAEAVEKLAGYSGVRIGVTGSFGKTSVKHILGQMLTLSGPVFYSRGSINTVLGLTRHIRQRLQPSHRYFIAEMGAYGPGSIKRLAEFVRPEIGIITAVGEAHLERFGSVEVTAQAKAELAEFVCEHGKLVIVTEAVAALAPFAALRAKHPDKFVVCGSGETCDIRLVSTTLENGARTFEIEMDGEHLSYVSPLLASYNALNICLCIAIIRAVAPDVLPYLNSAIADLEQVPHRLEKKDGAAGPLILDDAYNANEAGIREAVKIMRALAVERGGRAVMVTPGIVELGNQHDAVHKSLGEWAGKRADIIHVVNPERIPSFVAGAKSAGHAKVETHLNLGLARKAMATDGLAREDVVLYANDLPDVLEEKRVL